MIISLISDGQSLLGQAVLHFGLKFVKEIKSYNMIMGKNVYNIDIHKQKKNNQLVKSLPIPYNTTINYNNTDIYIDTINHGNPKEFSTHTGYFFSIKIMSDDGNQEVLDNFLTEALKYYKKHILDYDYAENKFIIHYYNRNWLLLNKRYKRHINTIFLKDNLETQILEYVKQFLTDESRDRHHRYGIPYHLNMLLEGFPGTGKTSLAMSLASELNYDISIINFDNEMTDNEFLNAIRRLPKKSILLLEDIDVLFEARKQNDDYKSALTFSGLLNALDGPGCKEGLIIILTTNFKCKLDNALIRPGRINKIINFEYADKGQTKKMFNAFYPDKEDEFKGFYQKIKKMEYTPAVLQQYFLNNLNFENIVIEEFEKLCSENKYKDKLVEMYS
jgi:mitochondrial chaperone BCS1